MLENAKKSTEIKKARTTPKNRKEKELSAVDIKSSASPNKIEASMETADSTPNSQRGNSKNKHYKRTNDRSNLAVCMKEKSCGHSRRSCQEKSTAIVKTHSQRSPLMKFEKSASVIKLAADKNETTEKKLH